MNSGLSLRRAVIGALVLFVSAMLALTGFTLTHLRQNAIAAGLEIAAAKSRSFEDYLTQSLQVTALAAAYVRSPAVEATELHETQRALSATLRQAPHLRSMSLLDEHGRILVSSNSANVGIIVNLSDYLPQIEGQQDVLRIGRPWGGRDFFGGVPSTVNAPVAAGMQNFIPVIQTLSIDKQTVFLLVALNSDYFVNHIFQSFDATQGSLEVLRFDGTLLLDSEPGYRAGTVKDYVMRDLNLAQVESGQFQQDLGARGSVLTAYRASRLYPLVVVTHFQRDTALQPWNTEAKTMLWVVLPTLLTICLLTFVFYRRQVLHLALRAQALREQRISATVFDSSAQAIIITDHNANIMSVNAAFTRITGYADSEVIGRNPKLLNSGCQDNSFYQQLWTELLKNGVWHGELINRRKDGSVYDAHLTITVALNPAGQIQHLIGVSTDITERKKIAALLAEKMRFLGTILDNSSVGITFVRDRTLIWSNQHMGEMFGYALAEIENKSTRSFYPSQDSYEELGRVGYAALAKVGDFSTDREMRHQNGSLIWMRLSAKLIDPEDASSGSIWVFEDISEQRRNQHQLLEAKNAAEAANVAKSRFLATMSHEIRTPMNGVLGMAQMLLMPNLSETDRSKYVRTILSSGKTLLALLNDILDLSKIEAGKFQLESTVFEPDSVLRETCALFDGGAQGKQLRLEHQWRGPAQQRYQSDSHRLRQMLANLVGNAVKFTSQGSVLVAATEVGRDDSTAMLEL